MAALLPESPSLEKQLAMRGFLDSLTQLYPCEICAKHFRNYWKANPLPDILTRTALQEWLCTFHNGVNIRLKKPTVSCARADLDQRWPDHLEPDCGCDSAEEEDPSASATGDSILPSATSPTSSSTTSSVATVATPISPRS